MIENIIELLNQDEYKNVSERVEIAKGKHKMPNSWKDVWYKIKRHSWLTKPSK
jgi:HEAT repeat protein